MPSLGIPNANELANIIPPEAQPFVLGAVGLGALAYYFYDSMDSRAFEKYDKKPLDEKVTEDLKFRLKKIGKKTDKNLTKDRDKVSSIGYYDKYQIRDDTLITPDMDMGNADEDDFSEVYVFMSSPTKDGIVGNIKYASWYVKDYLFEDGKADIYIVDAGSVTKTRNEFVLDNDIQFLPTTYSGVMVQNTQSATNVVQQIATVDAQGELTNSMSEFLSKVEHFEIEHLKKMNEMEKEGEIERARQEGLID